MISYFDVRKLSAERLLEGWRWLCPQDLRLVAINAFGDLFLENHDGSILRLDVSAGLLVPISDSLANFECSASNPANQKAWFFSDVEARLEQTGYHLGYNQCFGYKIPLVFKESTGVADNVYVADPYDLVSFLGNLHQQLRDQPDGARVRLNIKPTP